MAEEKNRFEEDDVEGHDWKGSIPIIPQEDAGAEVEGHGPWSHPIPTIPQEDAEGDVQGHSVTPEDEMTSEDDDVEGHHIKRPGDDPRIVP